MTETDMTNCAELREALVQIDALDPEGHTAGFSVDALRGLIERMGAIARAALKEAPAYAEAETDMTEYAELLRHLRLLARGKHDDVSIAADAAGAIIALLAERDALAKDAARYRYIRDKRAVSFGASMDGCSIFGVSDWALPRAPTFDAAIDAAMEGEK